MKKFTIVCLLVVTMLMQSFTALYVAAQDAIRTTTISSEDAYVDSDGTKKVSSKGYLIYTTLGKRVPALKFSLADIKEKVESGMDLKSVTLRMYIRGQSESSVMTYAVNFQPFYSSNDNWTAADDNFPNMTLGADCTYTKNDDFWSTPIADKITVPVGAGYASNSDIGVTSPFYYDFDITSAVTSELAKADDGFISILLGIESGKSRNICFFGKDNKDAQKYGYQPQLIADYEAAKPETITITRTLSTGTVNKFADLTIPANTVAYTKLTSSSCKDLLLQKLADGESIFAGQIRVEEQTVADEFMSLRGSGTGSTVLLKVTYQDDSVVDYNSYDTGSSGYYDSKSNMHIRKGTQESDSHAYFKIDISALADKVDQIKEAVIGINPYGSDECGEFKLGFYELDKTDWSGADINYNYEPLFAVSSPVETVGTGVHIVNTKILNDFRTDKNIAMIVALYKEADEIDRLCNVYMLSTTVGAASEKSIYTQVPVPDDGGQYKIKAFVLDGVSTLSSYMEAAVWE